MTPTRNNIATTAPYRLNARAFTAVELIATLALATVLMAAVLSITGNLARNLRSQKQTQNHSKQTLWLNAAHKIIATDLLHAQQVTSTKTGLHIIGYATINNPPNNTTHHPVHIDYIIDNSETPTRLWRQQHQLNTTPARTTRQLVALGVTDIQFTTPLTDSAPPDDANNPSAPTASEYSITLVTQQPPTRETHPP